jgi:alanine racemase
MSVQSHAPDASGPPAAEAGAILTIDLGAIVANWRALVQRAGTAECTAVVKADAYGCGLEPVGKALSDAGCRTFFVAHLSEARRLRAVAADATIYVLNGLLPATATVYADMRLRPVLGSVDELTEWNAFCDASGWREGAALHVDTGMNRLGLHPQRAAAVANDKISSANLKLLMSHFACSEEPAHPLNARQMGIFREVRALFPALPASLANSSGIFLGPDAHHDLVRPGVALYGANPTPGHANLMRPVVRLEARILQLREAPEGETVGYGANWTARRPTRLAIVSAGYADGFLRAGSASDLHMGAEAIVGGHRCPIAGRISMDLTAIDVTDVRSRALRRGDWVALIDDTIDIDECAARAGAIAYEVLTSLGHRYRRLYRD